MWFLFRVITGVFSGDGEPKATTTIDHETMTCRYIQTRERGAVGIVTGGADGVARTIDLGREGHIAQIVAADGYAGDGCRGSDAAARNALAYTIDGGCGVVAGLTWCHAATATTGSDVAGSTSTL